jgi:N-acetylmuramoyl-L-alanine amidase
MKQPITLSGVMLVLLALSVAPISAAPVMISDIQYWLAPDHIQTIISLNSPVQPRSQQRANPTRFVLEFPNAESLRGAESIPVNDVTLRQIRVHRLNNGTTQIVFDLKVPVEADVQVLPQADGQPDRIVVNLFDQARKTQSQQPPAEKTQVAARLKARENYIVVLDPGHGGQDPGAVGPNGLEEKAVVLDLARQMQRLIQENAPDIKVFLTRDKDSFLPLPKRTALAEERHADLFISLHINASPSSKVQGFSVYTLSENASDEAARELADKENAADVLFGGIATPIPDNDPLLTLVLADLTKTSWLQHSLNFGQMVVNMTVANLRKEKIAKEGLKRANFVVLRTADMPAVLVEACYLSNAKEEELLAGETFRAKIAQSLAKSTIDYFAQMRNSKKAQVAQLREEPAAQPVVYMAETAQASPPQKAHVVKAGETLSTIAESYNIDLAQFCQANNLDGTDVIYVGQRLWLP